MATITTTITLRLTGKSGLLAATATYDGSDPYAVCVSFQDAQSNVEWVFDRTLMIDGLKISAGSGDVQIWLEDADTAVIRLQSPDGTAILRTSTAPLNAFVAQMLRLVPLGHELDHLDISTELDSLLAE
jgi:hypothetical protein